ncbi:MAG: type II toxin-antitoxin system RelE/ParE family toxin [Beijerinckiaceae bacterium]
MIDQFRDKAVKHLFETGEARGPWRAFAGIARRKLDMLNAAGVIGDLLAPPGNRLEQLKGDRAGQWSIRINR